MLRTNSKKAAENIRVHIMGNFTPEGYTDDQPQKFPEIAAFILDTFRSEKYGCPQDVRYYHGSEAAAFADWCAGLPQEKTRYTEQQAEQLLTSLIYREL